MKFLNKLKFLFKKYPKFEPCHTSIETLPIFNWFKIIETGDLKYLYFDYQNKTAPTSFENIYAEMIFQFETIDITIFDLHAKKALAEAQWLIEKKPHYKMNAKQIEIEIQSRIKEISSAKKQTLNEFVNYIELTFNTIGSIRVNEMSTGRAYSLFHQAVKINEQKIKQNATNKKN